ncbi:FAD-dependent oxidoreductase [Pseudomonas sp. NFXW11]|uniref:FAD-dependent oxidoreductase n=1 Tax=Pseudomonas sp. NFXW11 TaxID=2819531 RepID=UPI003CF96CD6
MLRINRMSSAEGKQVEPTVNQFVKQSVYYPDQPAVKWQEVAMGKMVADGAIANDQPLSICVVGRGAAAVAALTELDQIAARNPNFQCQVSNAYYETEIEETADAEVNYDSKWGRIFAVKPGDNFQEIGCMRFPSIAVLTWSFIAHAYPDNLDDELSVFPNPGRVPTQFLFRDMNVIFDRSGVIEDMNSEEQLANFKVMDAVKNGVINYLLSLEDAAGRSAASFATNLVGVDGAAAPIASFTEEQVKQEWEDWDRYIAEFDVPLIDKVHEAIDALIADGSIQLTADRDPTYFVELFGRYGFGTGGFRPLNNVTFTEIARLLIWNYSDEYFFPGNLGDGAARNADLPARLYQRLSHINLKSEVKKVLFAGRKSDGKILLISKTGKTSQQPSEVVVETFDHVIIAAGNHASQKILEPFSGLGPGESIPLDTPLYFDVNDQVFEYRTQELLSHPLDQLHGGSGNLYAALKQLHMMRSTKYFIDVPAPLFEAYAPSDGRNTVKMVISDTDLAATYCMQGQNGSYNILASYTWGDEASNEASRLRGLTPTAGVNDDVLRVRHAQAASRIALNEVNQPPQFWLSSLLAARAAEGAPSYMYDWSADRDTRGAFKLDWAGDTELCTQIYNHYRSSVLNAEQAKQGKQCLFVAGDSVSHYGGWLEGAFMTGVTSVAGLIRSEFGAQVFSAQGQKLFNHLA